MFPNFIFCRFRPLFHLRRVEEGDSGEIENENNACNGLLWGQDPGERTLDWES